MPGLVAGLDALLVACVLLAAMFAVSTIFRPLLINVLAQAPFVGGWLASNVDSGLANFQRAITGPANASLYLVSSSLDWLATQGRALTTGLTDALGAALWTSWVIATVTIPDAASKTLQQAEALAQDARGYALGLWQSAEHDIATSSSMAEAALGGAVSVLRSDLSSEISAAESVVLLEIRRAEQNAGALFSQAEYDAQQAVAATEIKLADLVSRAREDLSAAVGAVEHDLRTLAEAERVALADSTSVLGGDIQAAEARANQAIGALEESTQKSIEGILSGLPWQSLAAAVGAGEAMLQADVRTLVGLGAKAIRDELGNAEALRAKYGPQIQALLSQVRGAA